MVALKTQTSIINLSEYKKQNEVKPVVVESKITNFEDLEVKKETGVKPLATNDIERFKNYMLNKPERYKGTNIRDYAIVVVGMNIGKRVSDLLNIKVGNVINENNEVVDYYTSVDQKTKKKITVYLNSNAKEAISMLLESKESWKATDYLFQSRKGNKLSRNRLWEIMNKAGEDLNLEYSVGTHTLRKTFATQAVIKSNKDYNAMSQIQNVLGHSKRETTMIYTEQNKEEQKEFMERIKI